MKGERINEHDDEEKVNNATAAICAMVGGLICVPQHIIITT